MHPLSRLHGGELQLLEALELPNFLSRLHGGKLAFSDMDNELWNF